MNTLEVNQQKVLESKSLLIEIIKEPLSFKDNEAIKIALKSQGGLAKFSDKERTIAACSLNTLKTASDALLNRGFVELDELRINAKNAIQKAIVGSKATKSTLTGLHNKVDSLESQLNTMRKSNLLLTRIIYELRSELKRMAYSSDTAEKIQNDYKNINYTIEAKLGYTLDGEV